MVISCDPRFAGDSFWTRARQFFGGRCWDGLELLDRGLLPRLAGIDSIDLLPHARLHIVAFDDLAIAINPKDSPANGTPSTIFGLGSGS